MGRRYFETGKRKKRTFLPFSVVSGLAIALVIVLMVIYKYYLKVFTPNVLLQSNEAEAFLHIPSGADYNQLKQLCRDQGFLGDPSTFDWVAKKMNLPSHVYPGKYLVKKNMSNYDFVSLLRSGKDLDVVITVNKVYQVEDLGHLAGQLLELDSSALVKEVLSPAYLEKTKCTRDDVLTRFIPNTYFFKWDTDVKSFLERMEKEYESFWNEAREKKAAEKYLSHKEVIILASIVQEEARHKDEMSKIAGVYLNRLKRGMLLQADPTVKFAVGDRSIKRVLNKHKETDSPFNTYKYAGLPPGPIILPQISAIDAVLNAEDHNYLYFCAKADMSGYHNFSTNYNQHLNYARQYQRALNKLNIR